MKRYKTGGFTLVELMITISIIIMVAMMVMPLVEAMTGSNRVEGTLLEVQGYMTMAQQEAVQYNKTVAVRFVPPTQLTSRPRLMIEIMKEGKTDPTDAGNWQIKAGTYGAKLLDMLKIENAGGQESFRIWFNSRGFIPQDCPDNNLQITAGPRTNETIEPTITYAINRATGRFLRFAPRIEYAQ
ncbi:MAG: hypothetical protein GWP05_06170 [Anaerolineaceae bacterium]|nr:hypothetical protein [Anaerolineaceae bacterium]